MIYNGKANYIAARKLFELFASRDLAKKALTSDYNLIDLQAIDDNSINYEKY